MWTVNNQPMDELGISVAGGTFNSFGVSFALLDAARNYDVSPLFAYGDSVVIRRNGSIFFQGKVAPPSKRADASYEGHDYPIEDAWADLETTIYQEEWKVGANQYLFPRAVLGLDKTGERITIGKQIREAIAFAAANGVAIQAGSIPEGEILWPEEVENISCADVIGKCLEFHPDWIPWINHSSTPPSLNVTRVSDMPLHIINPAGGNVESLTVTDRGDLRPKAVRIVYEYASQIDDEVLRNAVIDKYPAGGPDAGPGMLCATIPLAGLQMQTQKSRIRTRPIPASGETGNPAKRFIVANYPRLANINLGDFDVEEFETEFVPDDLADNPDPDPINEYAQRLIPSGLSQVPNQLVEGNIEDWMRKRVGRVKFTAKVKASSGASEDVRKKLAGDLPSGITVATNATTKIYKNMTQWSREEDAPTGIAQAVYESMMAAYKTEGEVTLSTDELTAVRYHGCKITLTGTGTVQVPIHSVSWDIPTGKATIGFGPIPALAPDGFLELQRRLRARKVTWWSKEERNDARLGAEKKPSARGDTVGGYHSPQTTFDGSGGGGVDAGGAFFKLIEKSGDTYLQGGSISATEGTQAPDDYKVLSDGDPDQGDNTKLWLKLDVDGIKDDDNEVLISGLKLTGASWGTGTTIPDSDFPTVAAGGHLYLEMGRWSEDGFFPAQSGNIILGGCPGNWNVTRG